MSPVASDTLAGVLDHVTVTRYVTPLREGGSLPALVEADNLGTYVMKFRGAGQGPLALVAEIIAGELARRLGLRVPDLVLADLDPRIPGSEPDPEIQDLLRASGGLNLGVDFLPGALDFDAARTGVDGLLAGQVLERPVVDQPELRDDVVIPCTVADAVLAKAPDAAKPFFRVPKVIER